MRVPSCSVLLVLLCLASSAAAQTSGSGTIAGNVHVTHDDVWTTPHSVVGTLIVENNSTLRIDGTTVNLAALSVMPGSAIVLQSEPNASARLAPFANDGWHGLVMGTLDAEGLPGALAVIEGLAGQSAPRSTSFGGGIEIVGSATLHHTAITNYTAGLEVPVSGTLRTDDAEFTSDHGVGVYIRDGRADIIGSSFAGAGGAIAVTPDAATLRVIDSTFDGSPDPLYFAGANLTVRNVTITRAGFCTDFQEGIIQVQDLTCRDFTRVGLYASPGGISGAPVILDVDGYQASTTNASAGHGSGIELHSVPHADIRNATLGPLPGDGLVALTTRFNLTSVRAHDIGLYTEVLGDPPFPVGNTSAVEGEAGKSGWLDVSWHVVPQVFYANGTLVDEASVTYALPATGATLESQTLHHGELTRQGDPLRAYAVDPSGHRVDFYYNATAQSRDGSQNGTIQFYPNGTPIQIHLAEAAVLTPATPQHRVDAASLISTLGVLAAIGFSCRRRA